MKKSTIIKKQLLVSFAKSFFWFTTGAMLGLFFIISFTTIAFQNIYKNAVYPGITIQGINFGGKTQEEVKDFFARKNTTIGKNIFTFKVDGEIATTSAQELDFGYNENLLAEQAYSIGRSKNIISDISLIFQAYLQGIYLPVSYRYSDEKLENILLPIRKKVAVAPVDALFTFQGGKVTAFQPSSNGQEIDIDTLKSDLSSKAPLLAQRFLPEHIIFNIPIRVLKPKATTDEVNSLGIKELVATGTSLFQGSVVNRIHNIKISSERLNGILIAPGETFSFLKAVGDISVLTGYKQAYVIENGRTVLGDGGGVCQVSTTLFRTALNAGLPITERHQHSYRVSYYEQDGLPGVDASIFMPGVDLQFKNNTQHHLLIQTNLDLSTQRLTFDLYGTRDGRLVIVSKPVVTNRTPAPPDAYQDDPSLPKGIVKQIERSIPGARATLTRTVLNDGKETSDTFVSNYQPWQAIYLRGTKE